MSLLPPTANQDYEGSMASVWFLILAAAMTIVPGLIHTFLPDGGAGVIAGIDLSTARERTIRLFAWAGATQIVWGLMLLVIGLRYRVLVPVALGLLLFERCVHAWTLWGPKGGTEGHHPPEAYLTLAALPLIAALFLLSLKRR